MRSKNFDLGSSPIELMNLKDEQGRAKNLCHIHQVSLNAIRSFSISLNDLYAAKSVRRSGSCTAYHSGHLFQEYYISYLHVDHLLSRQEYLGIDITLGSRCVLIATAIGRNFTAVDHLDQTTPRNLHNELHDLCNLRAMKSVAALLAAGSESITVAMKL